MSLRLVGLGSPGMSIGMPHAAGIYSLPPTPPHGRKNAILKPARLRARHHVAYLEKTGYPLLLAMEVGIGYDSELRVARRGRPVHEVAYDPSYHPFALHFLINGAWKILRLYDVPPAERLVPAYEAGRGLPPEDEAELQEKFPMLPPRELHNVSRFLYDGLTRQLTSMPSDIRVEREIAECLPEHRAAQTRYLRQQVRDLELHFAPEIAEISPRRIYRASTAMNIVLVEEASELTGESVGSLARRNPHRLLGQRLRGQLHSVSEAGHRGDRRVTDQWAEELSLEGWYSWVRSHEV